MIGKSTDPGVILQAAWRVKSSATSLIQPGLPIPSNQIYI